MRHARTLAALAAVVVLTTGANGDAWGLVFFGGVVLSLVPLASLPLALLYHTWRPDVVRHIAVAYGASRRTSTIVLGAAFGFVALILVSALFQAQAWPLGAPLLMAAYAYFLLGLAGCARRQGLRLLHTDVEDDDGTRLKPLVIGWLARSSLLAVPLLWPVFGAYLIATCLGAPFVAWMDSRRRHKDTAPAEEG